MLIRDKTIKIITITEKKLVKNYFIGLYR